MGTFGGALEARQVNASQGNLVCEVTGEIELNSNNVLVIRRIHALYKLRAPEAQREVIERVHRIHMDRCPVAVSLTRSSTENWPGIEG